MRLKKILAIQLDYDVKMKNEVTEQQKNIIIKTLMKEISSMIEWIGEYNGCDETSSGNHFKCQ